ncbi:MAG TPA: uroporphyrinogen decarboxylase [Thermoanaerobaculia bacterium]
MTTSPPSAKRLLEACHGRPVDRPPAWMMRQAGRYLPEYREVRGRVSFLELCRDVDLAAEVSLQPFRRFAPDGVVFFSDILVPVQAMGARVEFGKDGPRLSHPVHTGDDVLRLRRFDPAGELRFTGGILKRLRGELGDSAAVIGFAGAPWTLACYLIEGGGSKSFAAIKQMMGWGQRTLEGLLNLLADVVGDVLSYQIASGAQVVQLFDTWAGELSLEDYRRWALPALTRAIAGIRREGQPVILYVNGSSHLLEAMDEAGADVLSIDWRLSLSEARKRLPTRPLQGNLDPGALLAGTRDVRRRVRSMLAETGGAGHVVNLGHGVLPQTPVESVAAFFAAVREEDAAVPAEAHA